MPRPRPGRGLLWLSAAFLLVGALLGSPAGAVGTLTAAALVAVLPILAGPALRRMVGTILLLAALALAATQLPAAREEMARYRAHILR